MDCSMPDFLVLHHLPEFAQTQVHWVTDAIQPSHPLPSLFPTVFNLPHHQGLFQWFSSSHQVVKVLELQLQPQFELKFHDWGFNFSHSREYSGFISFRINWLGLLAVQGILKSLLQHHSLKVSILWCSSFFIVQPSHPYMTTGKTVILTRQTFVSKGMSLLFDMLSRLVIAFLLRSKCHLVSWLQSPSAVLLEPKKIKYVIVSPSICHEVMRPDAVIFVFWLLSFKSAF